jgi:hypothetical protein
MQAAPIQMDRDMDGYDEANRRFLQLCKRMPKKDDACSLTPHTAKQDCSKIMITKHQWKR